MFVCIKSCENEVQINIQSFFMGVDMVYITSILVKRNAENLVSEKTKIRNRFFSSCHHIKRKYTFIRCIEIYRINVILIFLIKLQNGKFNSI